MKRPWFRQNPHLLEEIKNYLKSDYPTIRLVEDDNIIFARGIFPLLFEGEIIDSYRIEIEFPQDYPKSCPRVREIGGRIPCEPDRHINSKDNDACLFIEEEWLVMVGPNPTFPQFLSGPVRNFFIGQSLVEAGNPWPFGERLHEKEGLFQAYGEWFDTKDEKRIIQYLECLSLNGLKGHWDCPCGSGKRIRNCHFNQLKDLRAKIPSSLAKNALNRLMRFLKGKN